MGKKNSINHFIDSQYNSPGHRTARGVGEGLADLARHRKPDELGNVLLVFGIVLCLFLYGSIILVLFQGLATSGTILPLLALAAFGTVLLILGIAMRIRKRK